MNNPTIIMGDAFGDGYFAEIQPSRIELHDSLLVQDSQIFVPEPATLALLVAGGVVVVYRRREG